MALASTEGALRPLGQQGRARAGFRKMYRRGFKFRAMGYYAQAVPGKS